MGKRKRTKSEQGRYAKNKGKGGEKELATYLQSLGFADARYIARHDVECPVSLPNIHFEVKRWGLQVAGNALTKAIIAACEQADRTAKGGQWVVFWRKDRDTTWRMTHIDKVRKTLVGDAMIRMELKRLNNPKPTERNDNEQPPQASDA